MSIPKCDIDFEFELLKLKHKSELAGQDFPNYIEGVLNLKEVNYWDYINLEILLDLQRPKTDFPDEMIFLTYHQICELYFKLVLWELDQLSNINKVDPAVFIDKIKRVCRYYKHLIASFDLILEGLEQSQFTRFRASLFPASAFQSFQYRLIDVYSTDIYNLVLPADRNAALSDGKFTTLCKKVYWQRNTTAAAKGTLSFQKKYATLLLQRAKEMRYKNINRIFTQHYANIPETNIIVTHLREFDLLANLHWPMVHFKGAAKHLQQKGLYSAAGTAGTNWKKYLPPSYQKKIFFPDIWTEEERENWGHRPFQKEVSPVIE